MSNIGTFPNRGGLTRFAERVASFCSVGSHSALTRSQASEARPGMLGLAKIGGSIYLLVEVDDCRSAADFLDPDILHAGSFGIEITGGHNYLASKRLLVAIACAIKIGQ